VHGGGEQGAAVVAGVTRVVQPIPPVSIVADVIQPNTTGEAYPSAGQAGKCDDLC